MQEKAVKSKQVDSEFPKIKAKSQPVRIYDLLSGGWFFRKEP
jgi:hypothetical protein